MRDLPLIKTGIWIAVFWLWAVPAWLMMKQARSAPEPAYTISRQIRYAFRLQNTTHKLLEKAEFWTYAPVKQTSAQQCVHIETSHPHELIVDDLGNQILYFVFEDLPPYAIRVVTIKADLMLAQAPNPVGVDNLKPFLGPEKYIESDNAQLKALAQTLKASNPSNTAENIYQWVSNHVTYSGFSGKDRGALYAFNNKKGDCTEYMYLYVALCRANAIPSRCVGGYVCRQNEILGPSKYHNWAEIYDNGTWQPVDTQKRVFKENPSQFIAMRIMGDTEGNPMGDHHRFRFEGKGLKVRMNP